MIAVAMECYSFKFKLKKYYYNLYYFLILQFDTSEYSDQYIRCFVFIFFVFQKAEHVIVLQFQSCSLHWLM